MTLAISEFLLSRIEAGDFPSAVYLVAEKGEVVTRAALGHAVLEPECLEAANNTLYDLASITKVLVTGLLSAICVERGLLSLDERADEYLYVFADPKYRMITVRDLLVHTSGLKAWLPLYLLASKKEKVVDFLTHQYDESALGSRVVYSDLNFITLQRILQGLLDKRIDAAFTDEVAGPLGLVETGFGPLKQKRPKIAASEHGNRFEEQTCKELGYLTEENGGNAHFRNETIWGEVHDGNAYFMGGVAGHAGLFSTADEVLKLAEQFLPAYTKLLKPEICELFRTNFTPNLNEHRSFAFQLASTPDSTASTKMSPESFGHLGFTGTSLWIDPVKERIFILLTNRTHVHDLPFANINSVRRRFHELAIEELDGKR